MKFPCIWLKSYLPCGKLHRPWQIGAGRSVSIKTKLFSGSMIIYQRVKSKICRLRLSRPMKSIWHPTLNGSNSTTCDSTRGAGLKNSGGTRSMTTWPKCDYFIGVELSNCTRAYIMRYICESSWKWAIFYIWEIYVGYNYNYSQQYEIVDVSANDHIDHPEWIHCNFTGKHW